MEWVRGFLTPLIKVLFIGGIFGGIGFFVIKSFNNAWSKQWKFIFKYKIRGKPYPEKKLLWCMEAIEKGIGWYDAKKILMVGGTSKSEINEVLWIYDHVISELNKEKGGENGRKHKGSYRKIEKQSTELPKF